MQNIHGEICYEVQKSLTVFVWEIDAKMAAIARPWGLFYLVSCT